MMDNNTSLPGLLAFIEKAEQDLTAFDNEIEENGFSRDSVGHAGLMYLALIEAAKTGEMWPWNAIYGLSKKLFDHDKLKSAWIILNGSLDIREIRPPEDFIEAARTDLNNISKESTYRKILESQEEEDWEEASRQTEKLLEKEDDPEIVKELKSAKAAYQKQGKRENSIRKYLSIFVGVTSIFLMAGHLIYTFVLSEDSNAGVLTGIERSIDETQIIPDIIKNEDQSLFVPIRPEHNAGPEGGIKEWTWCLHRAKIINAVQEAVPANQRRSFISVETDFNSRCKGIKEPPQEQKYLAIRYVNNQNYTKIRDEIIRNL